MPMFDIGEGEFATLLDAAEIEMRLAHGGLTTVIGRHPDLGAFVVTQTPAELGREFVLVTGEDEGVAIRVLDEWGAISGADNARFAAEAGAQLDRLVANGHG